MNGTSSTGAQDIPLDHYIPLHLLNALMSESNSNRMSPTVLNHSRYHLTPNGVSHRNGCSFHVNEVRFLNIDNCVLSSYNSV